MSNNTRVLENVNTRVVCLFNTAVLKLQSMKYGERLKLARNQKKLSQPKLAELSGVGQGTISKIERGDQEFSGYDSALSKALDVHPFWLSSGDINYAPEWLYIEARPITRALPAPIIESNATWFGSFDLWDESTPLHEDDVALPFFREVRLAAGSGVCEVQENHGPKLRFSKSTLRRYEVNTPDAAIVIADGNSMEPGIPDGSAVGIDTSKKEILNGELYAIDHDGHLRIKQLYSMPGGVIRLRSNNSDEWPDEYYKGEEAQKIKVLGWVFWVSYLRKWKA